MNVKKQLEPREERLRKAAARLAWQNHGLYRVAMKVKAFYRGQCRVEPKRKHRLEKALNPKQNGADAIIDEFAAALGAYMPGEYPLQPLRIAYRSTERLIEDGLESVCRSRTLNNLATLLADMRSYFTTPGRPITIEWHLHEIEHFRKLWKDGCYANSNAYYDFTTAALDKCEAESTTGTTRDARKPQTHYRARAAISFKRASLLSGFSERTIKNLEKDPKNSAYPGRNVSEYAFLAWSVGYQAEKVKRHWANMINHPIPISSLPNFLQAKLGFEKGETFGQS